MMTRGRLSTALTGAMLALGWSSCAWADQFADLRAICIQTMTVVYEDCSIENISICPNGDRLHEASGVDGSKYFQIHNSEYGPVSWVNLASGEGWRSVLRTDAPFSLSELLREGQSAGSYLVDLLMFFPASRPAAATFNARLTGESQVLGNVTFETGSLEVGLGIGTGGTVAVISGPIYVDKQRRLILTESQTMTFNGATTAIGQQIIDVILPGEPGFMPDEASEDCLGVVSYTPRLSQPFDRLTSEPLITASMVQQ